jgi:RHS repeat-associated protein
VAVELIAGLIRISPDSAGAVDGLNLYVYVGNNPLKYRDPT